MISMDRGCYHLIDSQFTFLIAYFVMILCTSVMHYYMLSLILNILS